MSALVVSQVLRTYHRKFLSEFLVAWLRISATSPRVPQLVSRMFQSAYPSVAVNIELETIGESRIRTRVGSPRSGSRQPMQARPNRSGPSTRRRGRAGSEEHNVTMSKMAESQDAPKAAPSEIFETQVRGARRRRPRIAHSTAITANNAVTSAPPRDEAFAI